MKPKRKECRHDESYTASFCSYIPCSERIHVAVTEMAALFPKVSVFLTFLLDFLAVNEKQGEGDVTGLIFDSSICILIHMLIRKG